MSAIIEHYQHEKGRLFVVGDIHGCYDELMQRLEQINFDFQKNVDKSYSLQIFNFMGKKVYELKNLSSKMNIELNDFYRGIYIFQLRDKNGSILESGKFQVNK